MDEIVIKQVSNGWKFKYFDAFTGEVTYSVFQTENFAEMILYLCDRVKVGNEPVDWTEIVEYLAQEYNRRIHSTEEEDHEPTG